jgi:hypothetical protein
LEYLSQLLGDESATMTEFVDNVGRYQRGEPVVGVMAATQNKPGPAQTFTTTATTKTTTVASSATTTPTLHINKWEAAKLSVAPPPPPQSASTKAQKGGIKSRVPAPAKNIVSSNNNTYKSKNTNPKKGAKVPPSLISLSSNNVVPSPPTTTTTTTTTAAAATTSSSIQAGTTTTTRTTTTTTVALKPVRPTGPPPRGKATIVCGCFGVRHPSLTNCLFCGRISCAKEGYDYCPFCGFLVEQVMEDDGRYVLNKTNKQTNKRTKHRCIHTCRRIIS